MTGDFGTTGSVTFLLDLIPAILILLLIIAFFYHWHRYQKEKRSLLEKTEAYQRAASVTEKEKLHS